MSTPSEKLAESLAVIAYKQMRSVESEINRRRGEPMRPADIHDKSLSSGARLSRSAQESVWLFH